MTRRFVLLLASMLLAAACNGPPVVAPTAPPTDTPLAPTASATPEDLPPTAFAPISDNPTVPPTAPGASGALTLADLPTLPDAVSITPGDRFSIQTTPSTPADVEAFYTDALADLGLAFADRQEDVAGVMGRGLLLEYVGGGAGASVYVMIMPEFENQLTGVLLTLDELIVRPPADAP